ncbi:MAG: methionine--tRNA ligase [Chloroflexi bacterium]|nr:methionine--tRNA ligase [Chloroflexota bacterium]
MPEKILVAVAWPYASGSRHLGHVAGFGVPSDVFARYQRLKGNDVLMVSGTDDHGTPTALRALKEGKTPQQISDYYNREIGENLATLGCSYDLFTRTATANHCAVTQDIVTRLWQNGYLFKKTVAAMYCETDRRFLPDRYVEGTCPHCSFAGARGDQCENCGRQLDPTDLIEPHCNLCGHTPVLRETEHFFLNLPAFAERLRAWVEKQGHWRPNVRNFTLGLLNEGLQPRPITRDIEWGVPIPAELGDYPDKRIYVWFDAVIGYLSASIEWAHYIAGDPERWREWWQNPQARHYYFMGKDNIVFHTIIWPSMLLGYSEESRSANQQISKSPIENRQSKIENRLQLPYDVVSSEFLTMEGRKSSSSRGHAVWLPYFFSRYDPDPLRYLLTIGGPETADTDFTWAEFLRRNNDELVATWGNLAHRVLSFTYRNFGSVPPPGPLDDLDKAVLAEAEAKFASVGALLDAARFKAAITEAMALAQSTNQYLDKKAPWLSIKTDRQAAATALYVALRVVDNLKILLCPFLPHSSQRLHEYLGYDGYIAGPLEFREVKEQVEGEAPEADSLTPHASRITSHASRFTPHRVLTCNPATWVGRWQPSQLPPGQQLRPPQPLFKKLDDSIVAEEVARMEQQAGE